jgi:hypothetical protein
VGVRGSGGGARFELLIGDCGPVAWAPGPMLENRLMSIKSKID